MFYNRNLCQLQSLQVEKWRAVETYIPGANRATDQETQVAMAWTHNKETCRQHHEEGYGGHPKGSASEDGRRPPGGAQLKPKRRSLAWRGDSSSWRPRTGGMANSGGRPMFRKERQELSRIAKMSGRVPNERLGTSRLSHVFLKIYPYDSTSKFQE